MSATMVDLAKVTQMLDAGWRVRIYKGPMGSYEVRARHPERIMIPRALRGIKKQTESTPGAMQHDDNYHIDDDGALMTDDFTPEQALTRMAYKVFGEIIW